MTGDGLRLALTGTPVLNHADELIARAGELGHTAFPITDHDSLAGAMELDHGLRLGLNVQNGEITHPAVAAALGVPMLPSGDMTEGHS